MQVVEITDVRRARITERPDPKPRGAFAVVKIEVAPMCTEYKSWKNGWRGDSLGHEAAGTVEAVEGTRDVRAGDRVVVMPQYPCGQCRLCRAGEFVYCEQSLNALAATGNTSGAATYAQKMIKQDWMLIPIPDDISTEHASLANCALGPAFGAARRLRLSGEDTVLITGMGPVGLGSVIVAKWFGARVIAVESAPFRADLARQLGADEVVNPQDPDAVKFIRSLTGGIGVDKAIECAGAVPAQRLAIDAVRRLGEVAWVGESGELTVKISEDFIRKGITVHGSWYYNLSDTAQVLRLIRESGPLMDRLITHRLPMREVETAFALQEMAETGKVLLLPWA
jgi:L-iditol 2-dehydrogenase